MRMDFILLRQSVIIIHGLKLSNIYIDITTRADMSPPESSTVLGSVRFSDS